MCFEVMKEWPGLIHPKNLAMTLVYEAVLTGNIDALNTFESSLILDAIWLADIDSSNRDALANTLFQLVSNQKISVDLAKQRLDFELLEAAQVISDASAWSKRQIRINTSQLYKQHRFNLWREESEGYSRLMVTLNQLASWSGTEHVFEELLRLIGIFDIDPNRVIDLIFDTAATRLNPSYIDLIKRFDFTPSTVSAIVGMKLGGLAENSMPDDYVEGLFLIIALAIQANVFELEDILPYFLQDVPKKSEEKEASSAMDSLTAHDTGRCISSDSSQLLWLCTSLLRINALDTFEKAMSLIHDDIWSIPLSRVICAYIKALLGYHDPLLLVHPTPDPTMSTLQYWLTRLGPTGLYHDHELIALLIKECNVNDLNWISIIVQFILPSLSISYGNPYLSYLLWSKLNSLHCMTRFEIYTRWRDLDHPHVLKAVSFAKSDLRRLLRRLSKENIKQYGRLLGKLVQSNPTIIFPLLLEQCQAYDNLIPPVIESCRYLTPLAYDILTFSLLQQLQKQQEHMKDDATFIASWLQRMASFIGQLGKRYAMDLLPIIEYLNDRMLDSRTVEICILEELISKLGNVESRWEVSDAQIEAMVGGPAVKAEMAPRNRRLTTKLNSLLTLDTWLLLGHQRNISEDFDEGILKLSSTLFDQATACFLQYSEYIGSSPEITLSDPREHEVWSSLSVDSQMTIWRTWIRRRQDFTFASLSNWREVFWGLDLGDLHVPIGRYQSEIARFKTLQITAESKRDRERAPVVVSVLEGELKARIQHVQTITTSLNTLPVNATISILIQDAIYPRCTLSSVDATYCSRFITLLHPRINMFTLLNELTDLLPTILIACTEREAKYFGRFYAELMTPIDSWHRDTDKFISEAQIKRQEDEEVLIDYEEFRHLLFTLHDKIVASCRECIEPEGEFLRLRSSIIFLSVLASASVFPRVDAHARSLLKAIKELKRRDAREDVKVMSVRVEASLKSANTMREADFHFVMDTSSLEKIAKEELKEDEGEGEMVEESIDQKTQMMDLEEGERESEMAKSPEMEASSSLIEMSRQQDSLVQQSKESLKQRITTAQPSSSPKETKKRSREPTPTRSERESKRREQPGTVQSQQHALSPREISERALRSGGQVDIRTTTTRESQGHGRSGERGARSRGRSNELSSSSQQPQYLPRPQDSRPDYPRDQYSSQSRHTEVASPDYQAQQQRLDPSRDLSGIGVIFVHPNPIVIVVTLKSDKGNCVNVILINLAPVDMVPLESLDNMCTDNIHPIHVFNQKNSLMINP